MLFKNATFTLLFVATQMTALGYAQTDIPGMPVTGYGLSGGANLTAQASYGLAGSGYYGGTQACPYKTKTSKAAVDMSDREIEERKKIKNLQAEIKLKENAKDRAEEKLEKLAEKIEKFFIPAVSDFLISTHMNGAMQCSGYRSYPDNKCDVLPEGLKRNTTGKIVDADGNEVKPIPTLTSDAKCKGLPEVIPELKDLWFKPDGVGNFCAASTPGSAGNINSAICAETSLRPTDGSKYKRFSTSDCAKALSEYRKTKMEIDKAADFVDAKNAEIEDRTEKVAGEREKVRLAKELKSRNDVEGGSDCILCAQNKGYEKPERDWFSTLANIGGGLGLAWYGKKIDESAQEYNAQLGFPSTNSYGYPFVTAGIYSVINGLAGPGAYGCSGGVGGSGFPYGGAGANGIYGANGYGPGAAQGGAFGYPASMYGSPWGGGMYNAGVGANGALNGPNGGFPFGVTGTAGLGIPVNGIGVPAAGGYQGVGGFQSNLQTCLTWPCANVGGALTGQIGVPAGGYQGLGFQAGSQYQLQLMQQQQAMLQAQAQQQAQMAQYYQAQVQAQQAAAQRQQMIAQQASQVQSEIQSLQMRLQMLVSGAYSGSSVGYGTGLGLSGSLGGSIYGGGSLGTGLGYGTAFGGVGSIYFGAATSTGYNTLPTLYNGVGTGVGTTRGR